MTILSTKDYIGPMQCLSCLHPQESIEHVLCDCPISRTLSKHHSNIPVTLVEIVVGSDTTVRICGLLLQSELEWKCLVCDELGQRV